MSSFGPGSSDPGSGLPIGWLVPIPEELPGAVAPIDMPTTPSNLYAVMGRIYAAGLECVHDGTLFVRRYTHARSENWRPPESSPFVDHAMVGYSGGDMNTMINGVRFVERKFLISRPHTILTSISDVTDTIVVDGVEYPIWNLKTVPRAGTNIMFWNIICRLGVDDGGA